MNLPRPVFNLSAVFRLCCLAVVASCWFGCATPQRGPTDDAAAASVKKRLGEIIDAAESRDFVQLDSYHWYGPHFTKFGSKGERLDAAAAREGEHQGLSALRGLKLRTDALKIDVFGDMAVATFIMAASFQTDANTVTNRDRGTLVFARHAGAWEIVHEHFSALP